jgi:hypothetical protein
MLGKSEQFIILEGLGVVLYWYVGITVPNIGGDEKYSIIEHNHSVFISFSLRIVPGKI